MRQIELGMISQRSRENYAYSPDGEHFVDDIMSALAGVETGSDGLVPLYRGVSAVAKHSDFVSGMSIVEDLQNVAYDEYSHHSEEYLDQVDDKAAEDLEDMIVGWLKCHGGPINFYRVSDIVKIRVEIDSLVEFVVAE